MKNTHIDENSVQIDREMVSEPVVTFSPAAMTQLALIVDNDITLKGKYFRILISGKGCDGFTYSTGFTDRESNDFVIEVKSGQTSLQVIMDPFAAFYLQEATVDYIQKHDDEGFVVTNHVQEKYAGKFWRNEGSRVPPLKKQ